MPTGANPTPPGSIRARAGALRRHLKSENVDHHHRHLRLGAIAGPRVYEMAELVRGYLRARRRHRLIFTLVLPAKAARALRAGANLAPDRAVGGRTWEDFLAARGPAQDGAR